MSGSGKEREIVSLESNLGTFPGRRELVLFISWKGREKQDASLAQKKVLVKEGPGREEIRSVVGQEAASALRRIFEGKKSEANLIPAHWEKTLELIKVPTRPLGYEREKDSNEEI